MRGQFIKGSVADMLINMEGSVNALAWAVAGLSILVILCLSWLYRLHRRFSTVFAGVNNSKNLADTIVDYYKKVGATYDKLNNLQKSYEHLAGIGARSIQKTGIVRFNPFRDTGGDQSFVLALLDNHDSGFLMTSIHGREGTRVYIKPVEYGSSKYALSEEEKGALKAALSPAKQRVKAANAK